MKKITLFSGYTVTAQAGGGFQQGMFVIESGKLLKCPIKIGFLIPHLRGEEGNGGGSQKHSSVNICPAIFH